LAKRSLRAHEPAAANRAAANFQIDLLPVAALQLGFVVERVHLRRAAVHEEKNAVFRLAGKMRRALSEGGCGRSRREGVLREEAVSIEEVGEGQSGEASAHLPEKLAAVAGATWSGRVHQILRTTLTSPTTSIDVDEFVEVENELTQVHQRRF